MKLSELIRDYRKRTNISQREFSRKCDLSNTYISFLENEKNPKTGRPLIPTLEQYKKLADGMDISVQRLFELLDSDAPVDLGLSPFEPPAEQPYTPKTIEARSLAKGLDTMPEARRKAIMDFMISMAPDIFTEWSEENDT